MLTTRQKVIRTLKYGLLGQLIIGQIRRLGFYFTPFYLHEEGTFGRPWEGSPKNFEGATMRFLKAVDMVDVASISGRSEAILLDRLDNDMACWGIKFQDQLAAYTWCNFKRCHDNLIPFDLNANEVYLFDAYTDKSFRGKNIAAYLRFYCYCKLEEMGYKRFYSITAYFNSPARKFKQKLHAKPVIFGAYVELKGQYSKTWILKTFRPNSVVAF